MAAARRPVLDGLAACAERARVHANRPERRKPQKPGPVTVTLQPLHVPEHRFPGSAHPTRVVAPDVDGKLIELAKLKPGESATFVGTVTHEAVAAEEAVEAVEANEDHGIEAVEAVPAKPGKPAVVSWSRKS